ncbi:Uncharacterised protein [Mycobacteroides abscessus subsp. massiliense]|nr:Uncharacterised protein [Mycobacteroides abscessus subsp. massiliense]
MSDCSWASEAQDGLAFKEHVFDALGFVRIAALFEDIDDM